jgi:excisionase family DNA binding protein
VLTVPEAAKRVGKSPETIRRWIRSGKLRATKVGMQHLVDEQDLEPFETDGPRLWIPLEWRTFSDGRPQPDWERIIREDRASH